MTRMRLNGKSRQGQMVQSSANRAKALDCCLLRVEQMKGEQEQKQQGGVLWQTEEMTVSRPRCR